ncbi:MAG: hypothetical protein JEY71_08470 [Sphaerochaeta sp.]|nr:hypothetical protein [Sphaerochaeta sp.]
MRQLSILQDSAGFYRTKAKTIHAISEILLSEYGGKVPCTSEELLKLPGVGMKGINTPGQALERGGVASFSAPKGGVSHLAFPALAR